jgi:hypothetical protein
MNEADKAKTIERLRESKWSKTMRILVCDRSLSKADCIDEMMHETELGLSLLDVFYNGAFVIDKMKEEYSLENAVTELHKQKVKE